MMTQHKKELKRFGISLALGMAIAAAILLLGGNVLALYPGVLSALLLGIALVIPQALLPLSTGVKRLRQIILSMFSFIILVLTFFLVVVPVGIVARITGKRFLDLQFRSSAKSHWVFRTSDAAATSRYEEQF